MEEVNYNNERIWIYPTPDQIRFDMKSFYCESESYTNQDSCIAYNKKCFVPLTFPFSTEQLTQPS